jgi:hypothetical protein
MRLKTNQDQSISITFETKCYENDWKFVLKTNYLDKMIKNCNIDFSFRQLIINNIINRASISKYAQQKVNKNIIDAYYFAADYIDDALKFFNIKKDSFGKGYYYSTAELVGLYLSKTKYHLHFASDSFLPNKHNSRWLIDAYDILEKRADILVANPSWNYQFNRAKDESFDKADHFYIGCGFSDQCYLVRTEDFKKDIYNYSHPDSNRYPSYGGELFEKRINSFMHQKKMFRLTSSNTTYIHNNFPHHLIKKYALFILIKLNLYFFLINIKIKSLHLQK